MTTINDGRIRLAMAGAGVALLAAACGGGGGNSAASTPAPSGTASGTTVSVTENEYRIMLSSSTFHPGTYTFVAQDTGHATHALEIDGPGVHDQRTGSLGPGKSASLTVTLAKGTYEVYCPIDGHRGLGMETQITVS